MHEHEAHARPALAVLDLADEKHVIAHALLRFIGETGVDMLQMRNLSIDPAFYNERMGVTGRGIGMYRLLQRIKKEFPKIQYGYFNRTREKFYPEGYETGWPIGG